MRQRENVVLVTKRPRERRGGDGRGAPEKEAREAQAAAQRTRLAKCR